MSNSGRFLDKVRCCVKVKEIKNVETALKKLGRMKVNNLYLVDDWDDGFHKSEFDATWYRVLHEYEMYIDEDGDYQYYNEKELDMLDVSSAVTTLKWLVATRHLTSHKDIRVYFEDYIILK